jgi:membrane protein DedA with SNARE-associated domain
MLMSAPPLPGVLQSLAPLLNHFGYLAVGGLVTLEDFGVPVPGETILIAASVYAGAGQLSIVGVGIVGFVAAIVGDNIGYAIGRFGGRALVLRYGRYVFITRERLAAAEGFFTRHGGKIVTVARFIEGLRQANGIIAGITGMHWLKFVAFNALGAALWVGLWTSLGYFSGRNIGTIYSYATQYSLYLLAVIAALIVALIVRRAIRHRHRAAAPDRDLS